jgi:hypothetical protein
MKNVILAFLFGVGLQFLVSKFFFKTNNSKLAKDGFQNEVIQDCSVVAKTEGSLADASVQNQNGLGQNNEKNSVELMNKPTDSNLEYLDDLNPQIKISKSHQLMISKFKKAINERRVTELEESDLDLISNVLSEPAISFVKANELSNNAQVGKLNGVFQGYLFVLNSKTKELEPRRATIDIETQESSDKPIMGKYKIEVESYGTSTGDGGFQGFRQSSKGYMIQFGPGRFLHVLSLDNEFKANVYDKDDLTGYASLKRVR